MITPYCQFAITRFTPTQAAGDCIALPPRVNSLHHQTVDRLGTDLRATAFAEDASIEGLEHESLPIVAVQWHPEERLDDLRLFAGLVQASSAYGQRKTQKVSA